MPLSFKSMEKEPVKAPEKIFVKIEISDKFRDIISQFKDDSIVARILLQGSACIDELVDDHVNYISMCNKDPNLISYLDQDRMVTISDPDFNFWTFKKRVVCKPGGFVKRLFKYIPDKEVEKFSNHYRAVVNKKPMEFRIVKGEEIKKYYLADNYSQQRGSLGSSCMKYPACQPFLDFYSKNSDIVSMLVLFDPADFVIGRALLWNFKDGVGKDVKLMDRIYTISDSEYQLKFKQWASQNGYLNKANQNFSDTFGFEKLGDPKMDFKAEVKLSNHISEKYPYFDTFKWLNKKTGVVSNFRPERSDDVVTLACPDGNVQTYDYMNLCEIGNVYHYGHEIVNVPYAKKSVHSTYVVYSETNNMYILKQDAVNDKEVRDWIFIDGSKNNQEALKKRVDYFKRAAKEEKKKSSLSWLDPIYDRYGSTFISSGVSTRELDSTQTSEPQEVQESQGTTTTNAAATQVTSGGVGQYTGRDSDYYRSYESFYQYTVPSRAYDPITGSVGVSSRSIGEVREEIRQVIVDELVAESSQENTPNSFPI